MLVPAGCSLMLVWLCRTLIIDDGWQLTEVDEEWQAHDKQAHRVRPTAAQLAAVSGMPGSTATAPGGDVNALAHPEAATEPRREERAQREAARAPQQARSGPLSLLLGLLAVLQGLLGLVEAWLMNGLHLAAQSLTTVLPGWGWAVVGRLAAGPLRAPILRLYASAGDHSRRLTSVKANAKFASLGAGPDEPWEVGLCQQGCSCHQLDLLSVAQRLTSSGREHDSLL